MNTGVQRSSATPLGAWTTTTPGAQTKRQTKKDLVGILAAHGVPYVATATIAYPEDLVAKLTRAKGLPGLKFLHVLAPCPAGWKIPSEQVVRYARLAVASRVFPLFEVDHDRWHLSIAPPPVPVADYVKGQGRFRFLARDAARLAAWQEDVDRRWRRLEAHLREA